MTGRRITSARVGRRRCGAAVAAGLFGTSVALGAASTAAAQVIHWSNALPAGHPILETVLKPWFADVARATGGRVRVAFRQAPWGPAPRQADIVELVIRHAAFANLDTTPQRFPVARIAELPFLSDSSEALSVAYWRTHVRFLARAGEFARARPLALAAHGPGLLWSPAKPFARLEDLQGARLLVVGATAAGVAERLGAAPLLMPPPLAAETLAAGRADAFLGLAGTVRRRALLPHLSRRIGIPGGLFANAHAVVVAPAIWNRIPAADRAAILTVSGESLARRLGAAWDREAAGIADEDKGLEKAEADPAFVAALRARLAGLEDRWRGAAAARGVAASAALAFLRAEIAREEVALRRGDGK